MGFEIYFQTGVNQPSVLPTLEELRTGLGGASGDEDTGLVLPPGMGGCWVPFSTSEDNRVVAFSVDRPTSDEALWEALYRILTSYHYCAYWPADSPPAFGRSDMEVVPDIIEALGIPRLVSDPADLPRWIRES